MIPTAADLRLLHRFDASNPWELAIHAAGHLVAAETHRDSPGDVLRRGRHLDPGAHITAVLALSTAAPATRAMFLFAGYAANEIARDEYREPNDLVFCVDIDDHDGVHLLEVVTHLPDGSAESFLVTAAGAAADLVRDRWARVEKLAGDLRAEGRSVSGDATALSA
jgi:hypothetical protein